jgi:hypothetical protein
MRLDPPLVIPQPGEERPRAVQIRLRRQNAGAAVEGLVVRRKILAADLAPVLPPIVALVALESERHGRGKAIADRDAGELADPKVISLRIIRERFQPTEQSGFVGEVRAERRSDHRCSRHGTHRPDGRKQIGAGGGDMLGKQE